MSSLFQDQENKEMIRRIEGLTTDTRPQWGKMTGAQMCVHCQRALQVAAGELKIKRGLIGMLLGGWAKKKFVIGSAPFKPNGPTGPEFIVTGEHDFSAEQAKLVGLVKRFAEGGPEGVAKEPHPFFGPMTDGEWDRLMWKHLDHHLRQFGV